MNFSIFSSKPSPRLWFRLAVVAAGSLIAGLVAFNLVVDPYDYIGVSPLDLEIQTNERLWKIDYLNAHVGDYDGYILGTSIAAQVRPSEADRLTGGRFYNMAMSGANAYDYELLLPYMLDRGYAVRRVLIVFDLANFWEHGELSREYERMHPDVSGDSSLEFYASYLTRFHLNGTLRKIKLNLGMEPYSPQTVYDRDSGVYHYTAQLAAIAEDEERYLRESRTLTENFVLRTPRDPQVFHRAMDSVDRVIEVCERNEIELTFIIPPHNYNYMNRVIFDQYGEYFRALAERTGFWDFSGYGTHNLNNKLYFDSMHFRPEVGDEILRVVYGNNDPNGFGAWVDATNLDAHLERRRAEFAKADTMFKQRSLD